MQSTFPICSLDWLERIYLASQATCVSFNIQKLQRSYVSTDWSCLLLRFSQLNTQPSLFSYLTLHCSYSTLLCILFVMQTPVFFCCFCMCGRLKQKKKSTFSSPGAAYAKSFLSTPEITALMCKAFKNQCTARVSSVTAMFVLFSSISWQQAAKWMIMSLTA